MSIDYTQRPSLTYQELLDTDSHEVPSVLRWFSPMPPSEEDVPVARYTTAEFHQVEVEKVWTKVWQMACREEDIPEPGDHLSYDIVGRSILVVRQESGEIQAFHNVCPHRGRKLKETRGRDTELRCAFHGFAWELGGCLKQVPCQWDFPRLEPDEWALPEVKVGTWGGFVFINMDPDCDTLEAHLGDLDAHFDRWPLQDRYKEAHVAKVMDCNWKVAQEAFMEAFHVVATHPQLLPSLGDAISQYDVFGNFCRAISPNGVPSPHVTWEPSQQDIFDAMSDRNLDEEPKAVVPEGETARHLAAESARASLRPAIGDRADELCDAELTESIYYTVFPNFHPWGAYNRIVYRFRPYGNDHRRSIMECMFLSPFVGERPPAAPIHWLNDDDDWTVATELGMLGRVFNQDVYNLPEVQAGLEAMIKPGVTFADYQETKPRHFHAILDEWVAAMSASEADAVTFDATDDEVVQCPYPHYRTMRDEAPVLELEGATVGRRGERVFAVSRHEDVKRILHDHKTFSSEFGSSAASAAPELRARLKEVYADGWPNVSTMLTEDPPSHTRYRRLVSMAFTPKRVSLLEPDIRRICEELVDGFEGAPRVDFLNQFAVPLPVAAVAAILQVPDTHRAEFKKWADSSVAAIGRIISDDERIAAERDIVEQQHYFVSELEDRRAEPRDDFLTDLLNAELPPDDEVEGGPLDIPEMLSIIRQIQVAGSETTASLLADLMVQLAQHPDEWEKLKADPDRAAKVVEEGLRWASPNQGLFRIVREDTEVAGTPIPKGSTIWVMYGSADHDDRVFDDPEAFDPDRERLNSHIAFGHGIHFCLGAALARLEAVTALKVLSAHLDTIEVVDPDSLRYGSSFILRGLQGLEVDVTYR